MLIRCLAINDRFIQELLEKSPNLKKMKWLEQLLSITLFTGWKFIGRQILEVERWYLWEQTTCTWHFHLHNVLYFSTIMTNCKTKCNCDFVLSHPLNKVQNVHDLLRGPITYTLILLTERYINVKALNLNSSQFCKYCLLTTSPALRSVYCPKVHV